MTDKIELIDLSSDSSADDDLLDNFFKSEAGEQFLSTFSYWDEMTNNAQQVIGTKRATDETSKADVHVKLAAKSRGKDLTALIDKDQPEQYCLPMSTKGKKNEKQNNVVHKETSKSPISSGTIEHHKHHKAAVNTHRIVTKTSQQMSANKLKNNGQKERSTEIDRSKPTKKRGMETNKTNPFIEKEKEKNCVTLSDVKEEPAKSSISEEIASETNSRDQMSEEWKEILNRETGLDKGYIPEKILGIQDMNGLILLYVSWKDPKIKNEVIPSKVLSVKYPQLVIDYYESLSVPINIFDELIPSRKV